MKGPQRGGRHVGKLYPRHEKTNAGFIRPVVLNSKDVEKTRHETVQPRHNERPREGARFYHLNHHGRVLDVAPNSYAVFQPFLGPASSQEVWNTGHLHQHGMKRKARVASGHKGGPKDLLLKMREGHQKDMAAADSVQSGKPGSQKPAPQGKTDQGHEGRVELCEFSGARRNTGQMRLLLLGAPNFMHVLFEFAFGGRVDAKSGEKVGAAKG